MASVDLYTRFLIALALVVALIAGAAWAAKRFGLAGRITAAAGEGAGSRSWRSPRSTASDVSCS